MRHIFILILLNIFLNAEVIFLSNLDKNIESKLSVDMNYLITPYDSTNSFDILNSKELTKVDKTNLWLQLDKEVWSKTSIKNLDDKNTTLVFINPMALNENIEVWIYNNNTLLQNIKSGVLEKRDDFNRFSRYTNIKLELQPAQEYSIITKIVNNKGRADIEWIAMSEEFFNKLSLYDNLVWGVVLGGIFLLFILHILLYSTIKSRSFLSYIIYIALCLIYFFTNSGYYALFFQGGYTSVILAHLSAYAVALFYILFLDEYMQLSKKAMYKYILKPIYTYYIFIATTSWIVIFSPAIYQYEIYYFIFTFIVIILLIIITAIESYKTRVLPVFYILGQFSLLVGYISIFLVAINVIPNNIYTQQTMGVFIFLEMILFTLAIFIRLKRTVEMKQKDEKLILSQSHFSTIGQMLRNVSHQWRVPAVRLGTLVTEIESILYIGKLQQPRIANILKDMRINIDFMEQTIVEFSKFYSKSEEIVDFKPIDEIYNIKTMLEEKINLQNLQIICNNSLENFFLKGNSTAFSHIVLILVENVLDVAKMRNIALPKIIIRVENIKNSQIISFEDNCGGIEQTPIDKIFELEVSTSNEKNRGVGLTIAKMIVEEKLNSTITVSNTDIGAKFSIIL